MSSQIPPDPITNTFNPGAWDLPELSTAEQAVLDSYYVKYPTAQNSLITFPSSITAAGVTSSSLTSTGALDISLPAASVLNVGVVAARSVVHHYSDGDNPSGAVHINNGSTNNSRTRIHDGTGANNTGIVDIMSSALNSGTINIGAASTTTNLLGTLKATTLDATADGSAQTVGSNLTTGSLTLAGGLTTGFVSMGNAVSGTTSTMNGGIIKQVIPLLSNSVFSGTIENVLGNATNITSLSTTFNRKALTNIGSIDCYEITSTVNYNSQYFELVVCGANDAMSGFSYKGCFSLERFASVTTASSVNTMFYYSSHGTGLTVTLTTVGNVTTLGIDSATGGAFNQRFVCTLTAYPTISIDNDLFDYSVTAI